jgi:hypothetical protein
VTKRQPLPYLIRKTSINTSQQKRCSAGHRTPLKVSDLAAACRSTRSARSRTAACSRRGQRDCLHVRNIYNQSLAVMAQKKRNVFA